MFKKLIKILMLILVASFFAITLRYYFSDKKKGEYVFREEDITLW